MLRITIWIERPLNNLDIIEKSVNESVEDLSFKSISPFIVESYSHLKASVVSQEVIPLVHVNTRDLVRNDLVQEVLFWTFK